MDTLIQAIEIFAAVTGVVYVILEILQKNAMSWVGIFSGAACAFEFATGEHILESFQKIVYVSHVDSLLIEAGSHAHSKCITFLIHIN